jgi:hypothetical protein
MKETKNSNHWRSSLQKERKEKKKITTEISVAS